MHALPGTLWRPETLKSSNKSLEDSPSKRSTLTLRASLCSSTSRNDLSIRLHGVLVDTLDTDCFGDLDENSRLAFRPGGVFGVTKTNSLLFLLSSTIPCDAPSISPAATMLLSGTDLNCAVVWDGPSSSSQSSEVREGGLGTMCCEAVTYRTSLSPLFSPSSPTSSQTSSKLSFMFSFSATPTVTELPSLQSGT